jgi:hypothetical protein
MDDMEKTDPVKEITKYAKRLPPDQQRALAEQLRFAQLLNRARELDKEMGAHQKKNKLKPLSMKEIVEVVNKVRSERKKKHAA